MPRKKQPEVTQEPLLFPESSMQCLLNESSVFHDVICAQEQELLHPQYCRKNGLLFEEDSINWLKHIPNGCIDMVFSDPPYNIGKEDWDVFKSQEQYIEWSMNWIREAARVLKPSGTLLICGFTEVLADLKHPAMKYFNGCRWLIWHYKNKANLGLDWGRSHESILLLRKSKCFTMNIDEIRIPYNAHTLKYPAHPQAESSQYGKGKRQEITWKPNPLGAKPKDVIDIPTTCNGMGEKTKHPTQKPEELLRKLVLATSNPGDIVLDPFSGSGTTLVVAEQLERRWIGCEINPEYNTWAINRIDHVIQKTISDWIMYDRENVKRRESIR